MTQQEECEVHCVFWDDDFTSGESMQLKTVGDTFLTTRLATRRKTPKTYPGIFNGTHYGCKERFKGFGVAARALAKIWQAARKEQSWGSVWVWPRSSMGHWLRYGWLQGKNQVGLVRPSGR